MTTKAQDQAERIATFIEEIEGEFEVEIEVTGGGKGWTAKADDGTEAKAGSKMLALEALHNRLDENRAEVESDDDEAEIDEEIECSEECQNANPNSPCTCRCGGLNHPREGSKEVVVFGPKPCKCGCGLTTKRAFVAGHDAAFHFAERAAAAGMDVEDYRKMLKAERNRKAAADRKAKRAAAKALQAKVEEIAKTIN